MKLKAWQVKSPYWHYLWHIYTNTLILAAHSSCQVGCYHVDQKNEYECHQFTLIAPVFEFTFSPHQVKFDDVWCDIIVLFEAMDCLNSPKSTSVTARSRLFALCDYWMLNQSTWKIEEFRHVDEGTKGCIISQFCPRISAFGRTARHVGVIGWT